MAKTKTKTKQERDLVGTLRARGLRKRVATSVASAMPAGAAARPPKQVTKVADDLRSLAHDLEERATGRTAKRKAAGRKAAQTRAAKAKKRSEAATKGARRRAKAAGAGVSRRAQATGRKTSRT